jgi:hypothetical protein
MGHASCRLLAMGVHGSGTAQRARWVDRQAARLAWRVRRPSFGSLGGAGQALGSRVERPYRAIILVRKRGTCAILSLMVTGWAARVGEDVEPTSWAECVAMLLSSGGDDALYRGQRCFDWDLRSSLERALLDYARANNQRAYELMLSMGEDEDTERWARGIEQGLLQRFRLQAMRFGVPKLPEAWDILGWWELMQHHGAPTRLMDWTTSPFIAVWFALDGHEDGMGNMAMWIYDRATALVNLRNEVTELKSSADYELLDDRQLQNRLVSSAIGGGNHILIPVRPRQFSRTVAQQSVLTVSPNIGVARTADWW